MTDPCTAAREHLSIDLDHEDGGDYGITPEAQRDARDHVAGCDECNRFAARMTVVRNSLRFEAIGAPPDVSGRVVGVLTEERAARPEPSVVGAADRVSGLSPARDRRVAHGRPRLLSQRARSVLPVAACFVVGVLLGANVFTERGSTPPPAAAGTLPERVAAAQHALRALDADIDVHEYGWQAAVPSRSFAGRLRFSAPESLAFSLRDTTAYPGAGWVPNDADVVVRDDGFWSRGLRPCTAPVTPACAGGVAVSSSVRNREPFDDRSVAPLDLLVPVRSFARADEPASLGTKVIDGRPSVGVVTTAAQAAPLLDGFRAAGNIRSFYPTDRVELWLDEVALVPVSLRVLSSASDDRRVWASARGHTEQGGEVVFTVDLHRLVIDGHIDPQAFVAPVPAGATIDDAGFTAVIDDARPAARVVPTAIPATFVSVRAGTVGTADGPAAVVRAWASGRAWLKLRVTDRWTGGRLFGEMGVAVRPIARPSGSTAYASADGTRLAIHGTDLDLVVEGSLTPAELLVVVESIGVVGVAVPADWPEAASATAGDAGAAVPGIRLPLAVPGFDPPALRIDEQVVTATYAGAGARTFVVVASPGDQLGPPLDISVWGVDVRGGPGRFSSARGELEWVEDHVVYSVRSSSLSLDEVIGVADGMSPP